MQPLLSAVVKAQAIPSSDQYQTHPLFLSKREKLQFVKQTE